MDRTDVARTECKLVHTKQILVHFFIAAGTLCKSGAHGATLKSEVILSVLHDVRNSNKLNFIQ